MTRTCVHVDLGQAQMTARDQASNPDPTPARARALAYPFSRPQHFGAWDLCRWAAPRSWQVRACPPPPKSRVPSPHICLHGLAAAPALTHARLRPALSVNQSLGVSRGQVGGIAMRFRCDHLRPFLATFDHV